VTLKVGHFVAGRWEQVMLTSVAGMADSTQGLGAGWAIGIGVVVLGLALLLGLARKYGGRDR
jgi:hypothetical protein